jgi:hypothetical protein
LPGDDEVDHASVFLEVAGAGLGAGRKLEPDPAVAVGLVPDVSEHADEHGVVGGDVDGLMDLTVRDQGCLMPLLGDRQQMLEGFLHASDVGVGAPYGRQGDGFGIECSAGLEQLAGLVGVHLGDPGVAVPL